MNKIFLFVFSLSIILFADIAKEDWRTIQSCDTLEVLLNERYAGIIYSYLLVSDSGVEVANALDIGTSMHEKRVYRFDGTLIYAEQEMSSPSGKNYWKLFRNADEWILSVTAGGVKQSKKVLAVRENISSLYEIYQGILKSSIKVGSSWTDTAFELTSGEYVFTTTVCSEVPNEKNGNIWMFQSNNSVNGKDEIWKLDKNGKTIYRELYPFVARVVNSSKKRDSIGQADLIETFKIPATRKLNSSEKIFLSFDSTVQLDSSVLSYYQETKNGYILKDKKQKCSDRPIKEKLNDSLSVYTVATPTMQTSHPDIIRLSKSLQKNAKTTCDLVKIYNDSIYRMISKRNTATFSSAIETLNSGFGDCGEHAVLLAALLRAAGIPARVVMGLVYMESGKGYYYHAWVSAYTGEWIFADPSHGVFPANYDRIPLMLDDNGQRLLQLSRLIGRVKIEYKSR